MAPKVLIIYSWLVRVITFFLPEIPLFQSFRGWLYSFGMKKCGRRFRVYGNVVLNRLEKLYVGDNVYLACGCVVTGGGVFKIGDNVLLGPYVIVATDNHEFDGESYATNYVFGEVIIERNSWIGGNSTLLLGTVIPHSSVVGAGSVCNRKYDKPYGLYVGQPARYVKDMRNQKVSNS